MTARLGWIAIVSLTISVVSLGLATWLSGASALAAFDRPWVGGNTCLGAPLARVFGHERAAASPATIKLDWDGSDSIDIKLPAQVFYQPGPRPEASVAGDPEFIQHVRLDGGALRADANFFRCGSEQRVVVRLSGPPVASWKMTGAGQLTLSALDQERLDVKLTGSSRLTAAGNVQQVSLDITGSARADLGKLTAQNARARITGSGDADLAAREAADLRITGSGSVTLHGQPKQLQTHVSGSGKIRNLP